MVSASFHDFGNEKNYHSLFLGVLEGFKTNYEIRSNRESGLGRYDILIIPKSKSKHTAFIIEFKISKTSKNLETKADEALIQIETNSYATEVIQYEHIKFIANIGLAFCGKEAKSAFKIDKIK